MVSGPAAGIAALVFGFVQQYGLSGLACITVLAGLMQIGFGVLRWGRVILLVPKPVLNGMLAAIGLIIAAGQIHVLLGGSVPDSFYSGIKGIPQAISTSFESTAWFPPVLLCGLLAIAIQMLWPKIKMGSKIPPALPAVIIATLFGLLYDIPKVEITPIFDTALTSLGLMLNLSIWTGVLGYIVPAIALAIIASAETLMTARAVDGIAPPMPPKANLNKELLAQGVGNTLSGCLGGIPITGVIIRSAANVSFGAKTRASTILHGVWILIFVTVLPFVLGLIPVTALAAVVIVTGFRLVNLKQLFSYVRTNLADAFMWSATCIGIVSTNLLIGLAIGLGAAVVLNAKSIAYFVRGQASRVKPLSQKTDAV